MARRRRQRSKVVRLADQAAPVADGVGRADAGSAWHVLVLTNEAGTHLYTTMARDVAAKVHACRTPVIAGYTQAHGIARLVLVERYFCRHTAYARMMRVRGWPVAERRALIDEQNPGWRDLCENPLAEAMADAPDAARPDAERFSAWRSS